MSTIRLFSILLSQYLPRWRSSHYAVTHVCNENSKHSREVALCDFPYHKEMLLKELCPFGSKLFPLREKGRN